MKRALVGVMVTIGWLAGCSPHLTGFTVEPPGRVAQERESHITLSEGAAIALDCFHPWHGACRSMTASVDDPAVARVHRGHVTGLRERWYRYVPRSSSTLVVVGLAPGETTLRFTSGPRENVYSISVIASPVDPGR